MIIPVYYATISGGVRSPWFPPSSSGKKTADSDSIRADSGDITVDSDIGSVLTADSSTLTADADNVTADSDNDSSLTADSSLHTADSSTITSDQQ